MDFEQELKKVIAIFQNILIFLASTCMLIFYYL